jgi:hypothetical protein
LLPNDRVRIQKFIFNRWATNHRAAMYSPHANSQCAACLDPDETAEHILKCKTPARDAIRTQWIEKLREYMEGHHTPPSVSAIITDGIQHWLDGEATPHLSTMERSASVHLKKAVREQHKLGWDHFIKGRITREWASFINHELRTRNVDIPSITQQKNGERTSLRLTGNLFWPYGKHGMQIHMVPNRRKKSLWRRRS